MPMVMPSRNSATTDLRVISLFMGKSSAFWMVIDGGSAVKAAAFGNEPFDKGCRAEIFRADKVRVMVQCRLDLRQADLVGPEHRPAQMARPAKAVGPDHVDVAGPGGGALVKDPGGLVHHCQQAAFLNLLVGDLARGGAGAGA